MTGNRHTTLKTHIIIATFELSAIFWPSGTIVAGLCHFIFSHAERRKDEKKKKKKNNAMRKDEKTKKNAMQKVIQNVCVIC